jgi:hypothetical protein
MSMTHHNQTKELTTWFLNLLLNESIDNKRHNIWSSNLRPYEAQLEDQRLRKAQDGHLEGKAARPTKDTKSGKPGQNGKEELRKAQKHKKLKNSPWIKLPLTLSMQAPPVRLTLSCFFSQPPD